MTVNRLELERKEFFPRIPGKVPLSLDPLSPTSFRFASFLWTNIGEGGQENREDWSDADWQTHLASPSHHFFAVSCEGEPIGCFEIVRCKTLMDAQGKVQITGFGLLPEFIGESIGPSVLTRVVEKAFALGARTVFLESEQDLGTVMLAVCEHQGFKLAHRA